MILPDDLKDSIAVIADEGVAAQIKIGRIIGAWMTIARVPHGRKMETYQACADWYYQCTGNEVSARTIRAWKYAADLVDELGDRYSQLPYSVFIASVNLASTCQNDLTIILDWAVANLPITVPQLMAHFSGTTSASLYAPPDHPAVSSVIRALRRVLPEGDPRWKIALPLVEQLRKLLSEEVS
jgi:hypothetical protein